MNESTNNNSVAALKPGYAKRTQNILPVVILSLAGLNVIFQVLWFWPFVRKNINYDAVSYIGISRHLLDGHFRESLHGYWSPFISWLIAAVSFFIHNLTLAGHVATILSFLLCLPLLYLFTLRLWKSPTLAALAVLWFTLSRDTTALSVFFIGADFLFSACVLLYFILLLGCLRHPSSRNWLLLGLAQGVAFLAKAFAMPWLTISTLVAVFFSNYRNIKKGFVHTALAMMIPFIVWCGWASALHIKYGVFTAGYQSKWNLLDPTTRNNDQHAGLSFLLDTSRSYDAYNVVDTMFPGSPAWQQHVILKTTIPIVLTKTRHNLPEAAKQILVLLTPGGIIALILTLLAVRSCLSHPESQLICVAVLNTVSLMIGYSMLVFDRRYVLPLIPILIAISVPFVLPPANIRNSGKVFRIARICAGSLLIFGLIFFQFYWASPFRTLRRDYQTSAYDGAATLRRLPSCSRLAAIGEGPFPEHGVGWEEEIYASYFSGCRIVAFVDHLPSDSELNDLEMDLNKVHPNGILIFRGKNDRSYELLLERFKKADSNILSKTISDPALGEVGQVLWNIKQF